MNRRKIITAAAAPPLSGAMVFAVPCIPAKLHDRAADNWHTMPAVADTSPVAAQCIAPHRAVADDVDDSMSLY